MQDWKKEFTEEKLDKTFHKVFDANTTSTIHSLAVKKRFKQIESQISEGKEASVFRALDYSGRFLAVKVYKISTSTFRNMLPYIKGEPRFEKVKKEKKDLVFAWARKEYKNLELAEKAGCRAPLPRAFKNNVLVMEFIGDGQGNPAPRLKDAPKNIELKPIYNQITKSFAKLLYKAKLVHGDLSEYNMLYNGGDIVFIDMGQAVSLQHPRAKDFLERDIRNISKYFSKRGFEKSVEQVKGDLKKWKRA